MRPFALLLVALVLVVPTAPAQTLDIRPAVELVIQSPPRTAFSLQTSTDLQTWLNFGSTTLGDGRPQQILVASSDSGGNAAFFRIHTNQVRDLTSLLEPIRAANRVPALACAVVLSNRIVGIGAVGVRKFGIPSAPVTVEDKWHHGSLTKSMTATLAAVLVEEGKLRWDTTLADVFPDWLPKMNADWRTATLEQLTSNRGGAPGDLGPSGIWTLLWNFTGTPRESRRLLLEKLTVLAPASKPGTQYEYSNAGFALAGHMLETVMNQPWEELITARVFLPLGMSSAGFGVPATPRYIDQPWGHQLSNGNPLPIEPGTSADNPPAIGPAGTVHCTVLDLARYAAFHVHGHLQDQPLLRASSLVKLHTAYPNNDNYAHGWIEVQRPWANPGKAYTHAGSNLQWYSVIWFAPARNFAVVALCNMATTSGANPANTATDQIAGKMIQEFLQ